MTPGRMPRSAPQLRGWLRAVRARPFALGGVACLFYAGALVLGMTLRGKDPTVVIWPAPGVLLALLLVAGRGNQRIVAAAALLAHTVVGLVASAGHPGVEAALGAVTTLEVVTAARLLRRAFPAPAVLARLDHVLALLALALGVAAGAGTLLASLVARLLGPGATSATQLAGDAPLLATWGSAWCADALGMLVLCPALLTWLQGPRERPEGPAGRVETLILFGLLLAAALAVFAGMGTPIAFPYALFPLLGWAAIRTAPRMVTLATVLVTAVAVWPGHPAAGAFGLSAPSALARFLSLQIFLAVLALSAMIVSAVITERRRAERAHQASQRLLNQAQRIARLGSWSWHAEGDRLNGSAEFFRLYGAGADAVWTPADALERIHPADRDRVRDMWETALRERQPPARLEYRIQRADGPDRSVSVDTRVETDDQGRLVGMLGIVHDITARREAERALAQSEARFRKAFHASPDAITLSTLDEGGFIDVNDGFVRISGYRASEVIGKTSRELGLWSRAGDRDLLVETLVRDGRARNLEMPIRTRDGSMRTCLVSAETFTLRDQRYLVAVTRDVTEQQAAARALEQSGQQLRALTSRLQDVREEERTSMSHEIHDELGQALTALKLDIAWFQTKLPAERTDLAERAASMLELTSATLSTVRQIAARLRPAVLDDLGLPAAIAWQVRDFARRADLAFTLEIEDDVTTHDAARDTAVFRILQEALTNVARHARAEGITVRLARHDDTLELALEDDGVGIRAQQVIGHGSLGLLGMRERAAALGGAVDVGPAERRGTRVTVRMPMAPRTEPTIDLRNGGAT